MESGTRCLSGISWSISKTRCHCKPSQHAESAEFKLTESALTLSNIMVPSSDIASCHCPPFEHVDKAAL